MALAGETIWVAPRVAKHRDFMPEGFTRSVGTLGPRPEELGFVVRPEEGAWRRRPDAEPHEARRRASPV